MALEETTFETRRLKQAIREQREFMNLNYEHEEEFSDDDAFEALDEECGRQQDGTCLYAGSEQCDWDCPFS